MVAVLLTELERAIIDKIRTEHVSFQVVVCDIYRLPFTKEGFVFKKKIEDKSSSYYEPPEDTQRKRLQTFKASGYGEVVEAGKEKTKVHLKRI